MQSLVAQPSPTTVAVVTTSQRPLELARLLESLAKSASPLSGVIVVDNGGDLATRGVAERAWPFPLVHHVPGTNLGCGGGLHAGELLAFARFGDAWTHLWILDDDAVIFPDTLPELLAAMAREQADAAHPLVMDSAGMLAWFPGLLDRAKFRAVRERQTPAQFRARCGEEPIAFSWAQGIALLVTRSALHELGPHRTDYWVRGEDLEFSLRITHRRRGIYVPRAEASHLPPRNPEAPSNTGEYFRHAAMLRNIAYTSVRLPHGRRIFRTLPGNALRFLRTWGWKPRVLRGLATALYAGAVRGKPAGADAPPALAAPLPEEAPRR